MVDLHRSPFDPAVADLRDMGTQAVELLSRFVDGRYDAPSSDYRDLEPLLTRLAAPPPDEPGELAALLATVEEAAGKGFDTANPGFFAYIPGGGLYASAVADFVACGINRYTGLALPAPALVQLEASVLRWLCDSFGLPPTSQGVLTPGGSMSNLSAIVAARAARLGDDFSRATMYTSDEVHHSVQKSARIVGLPADAVRSVSTDDALRLDPVALRAAVAADRAAGRTPFLVVASAGTINSGAVDPLTEIAAVAAQEGLWFHVDAAYGGFFQLTGRGRDALTGIELADSITLDPHKGLFLPYGTGCLLARDGATLRAAHELQAHYLPELSDGLPDFSSYTPELTRDFRGLRLWLPLHLHGTQAFVDALDEKLDLARWVHEQLRDVPELEVPWAPDLSLVVFRPRGGTDADTAGLLDRINGSGRVWLSSAPIRGTVYLRMCILSHRSRPERVHEAVDIIRSAATSGAVDPSLP